VDNPHISAIIPTYNRAHFLPRSVASVLAAVAAEDEVIVVDDGSTDATEAALAPFRPRVRYVRVAHGGVGRARNEGTRAATRPFVAHHDSDDEWHPDKLRLQRRLMQARPDVLFCISDFGVRLQSGEVRPKQLFHWHKDPRPWSAVLGAGVPYSRLAPLPPGHEDFDVYIGDLYPNALERCYLPTFTLLVRREQAGAALRFAEDVSVYEDRECFIRLTRAGKAAFLDCDTAVQWEHSEPRLTDITAFQRATYELTVLRRTLGRDEEYLARHGERYARKVRELHLTRAQCLLVQGETKEARHDLRLAGGGPLSQRLLARLPGPLARGLFAVRRSLRGAARRQAS
jgi:glycosyltransferase involved in cell wall biosynthesis